MANFIKAHWKILLGAIVLLVVFIVGVSAGRGIESIGAGGGVLGLILGWIHPSPKPDPELAAAARESSDALAQLHAADAEVGGAAQKLGQALESGNNLATTGQGLMASDADLIRQTELSQGQGNSSPTGGK